MSVFTPASNDLSVRILNHLFGAGWQSAYLHHTAAGAAGVLAHMFQVFNTIVVAGVTAYFAYVMVTGVVGSAHEGVVGGRRLHHFWVPLRGVTGVSLVAPLPWAKGFCLLQLLVLAFTGYGIGAADHLWNQAVMYIGAHPGRLQASADETVYAPPLARALLRSLVARDYLLHDDGSQVQRHARWTATPVVQGQSADGGTVVSTHTASIIQGNVVFGMPAPTGQGSDHAQAQYIRHTLHFTHIKDLPVAALGNVHFRCPPQVGTLICERRRGAITQLYDALQRVANDVVHNRMVPAATVRHAMKAYTRRIAKIDRDWIEHIHRAEAQWLRRWTVSARHQGWFTAGEWANVLSEESGRLDALGQARAHVAPMDTKALNQAAQLQTDPPLKGDLQWADQLMARASAGGAFSNADALARARPHLSHGSDTANLVDKTLSTKVTHALKGLVASVTAAPNPMAALTRWGHDLITAGEVAAGGGVALSAIPFFHIRPGLLYWTLVGSVIAMGADLAVVIPALPFVVFTMAAVGWILLVIEATVAAPLWGAAHALPEGEGWTGTHARQGYMLFLSVLMRPPLMMFGLFIAMALFTVAANLVGAGFGVFINSHTSYVFGLVSAIAYLAIIVSLITWVTYQAFKLVTLLAEQVPRWIGQLGTQLGEHQEARGHRTTIVGGIGRGGRKGGEAAGKAMRTATAVSHVDPHIAGPADRGSNPEPPSETGGTGPDPGVDASSHRGKNPDDPGEQS